MTKTLIAAIAIAASLAAPALAQQNSQTATATFNNTDGKESGRATLTSTANGVLFEVEISDLPPGKWVAFHVHETGTCEHGDHFKSAGAHFNPTNKDHGYLASNGPHAGDMPNQYVGSDGVLRAQVFNSFVSLDDKENGIRGRALMIHDRSDDYRSQPAGDAGDRLSCAVVR